MRDQVARIDLMQEETRKIGRDYTLAGWQLVITGMIAGAALIGATAAFMKWATDPGTFQRMLGLAAVAQRGLSNILECDDRLIRRWAGGQADIPASVAAWLETLAQAHDAIPPPKGWKRRQSIQAD